MTETSDCWKKGIKLGYSIVAECSVAQSFGDSNELTRVFEMNACGRLRHIQKYSSARSDKLAKWFDIQASWLNRLIIQMKQG